MINKNFFLFVALLLCSICAQAQIGIYPLTQYSRGIDASSNSSARTASLLSDPNDDSITLKLPFIEDFSGNLVPLDTITIDTINGNPVYQIKNLKLHGLKSKDTIKLFNIQGQSSDPVLGISNPAGTLIKYVQIIGKDGYTFQLFDDDALTTPTPIGTNKMVRCDWVRVGNYGYSTAPDTLCFWPNNGGAYINDQVAINPISAGVATFDGVNYMGIPYSTGRVSGYADNLTSHKFDLSSYTKDDAIYISFYWQYKSLSDSPILSEFFALEFNMAESDTTQWVEVWRQYGNPNDVLDTFRVTMVAINKLDSLLPNMTDSTFYTPFHKQFRYRFRSYGVLSGMFNVWNLDYIFIDKKRNPNKPHTDDLTIVKIENNCLKNYTSIPYHHFKTLSVSQQVAQVNDSAKVTIRALKDNEVQDPTCYLATRDNLGNTFNTVNGRFNPSGSGLTVPATFPAKIPIDTIDASKMTQPYVLKQEYFFSNLDSIRPYDLSFNNFKAIETVFYDYYAYDDGGAEFSLQTDESGLTLVNKYTILQADELTGMDICFVRSSGPNLTGRSIYLQVWSVNPLKLIGNQLIAVEYGNNTNGFVRYNLSQASNLITDTKGTDFYALPAGDYYFGYQQKFNDLLTVGYDRNTNHLDKIFLNTTGSTVWTPFSTRTSVTGSLMIRPVFSKNETLTSTIDQSVQPKQFEIYPNPAHNELHFTGEPEYMILYDVTGKIIYENSILNTPTILLPASISDGLYITVLSKGDITEIKRLIIQ